MLPTFAAVLGKILGKKQGVFAIEILELWLKDLNEHKESTDLQKDTKEAVKVARRLVKIMIGKYLEGEKERLHPYEDET